MANLIKRAVVRKPYHHITAEGKNVVIPVGDVIEVTAAQALAFPQNLVAPEVLEAQKIADEAVKVAKAAAAAAKAATLRGDDIPEVNDKKDNVKTSLGKGSGDSK